MYLGCGNIKEPVTTQFIASPTNTTKANIVKELFFFTHIRINAAIKSAYIISETMIRLLGLIFAFEITKALVTFAQKTNIAPVLLPLNSFAALTLMQVFINSAATSLDFLRASFPDKYCL